MPNLPSINLDIVGRQVVASLDVLHLQIDKHSITKDNTP